MKDTNQDALEQLIAEQESSRTANLQAENSLPSINTKKNPGSRASSKFSSWNNEAEAE